MSELAKRNPNEWQTSIERYDKKLTVRIGRKALLFSFLNTQLYEHGKGYEQFDHVFRVNDDQSSGTYYLRDEYRELYDALVEHEFPRLFRPYPTEADERTITDHLSKQVISGLEGLLEGGDNE